MRHINTRQIDSHLWKFEVTDGYDVQWTAQTCSHDTRRLEIFRGKKDYGKPAAYAMLIGVNESEVLGEAMTLVYNWAQNGPCGVELLDLRWIVDDPVLEISYRG